MADKSTAMRSDRNLALFQSRGSRADAGAGVASSGGNGDERPIARNPPPPPHRPTSAVPASLTSRLSDEIQRSQRHAFENTRKQVTAVLGRPSYAEDGFILYNGDCLESLRALAKSDFRAALTVTSPPYNIGKSYESVRDLTEYVDWCVEWIDAVHSVTADRGSFWLNLGYVPVPGKGRAVPIPYLLWNRTPFYLMQEIVWNYGAGVTTKSAFAPRNEKWLFYVREESSYVFNLDAVRDPNVKYPNQKKNGKFRCNPLGKNPSDVWQFPKVTTGAKRSSRERTSHPAQFPLGIVERIVRASSHACEVVLDPFSGSASAGIAAVGAGRVFIGFELRSDYCEMAIDRFQRFRRMVQTSASQARLLE